MYLAFSTISPSCFSYLNVYHPSYHRHSLSAFVITMEVYLPSPLWLPRFLAPRMEYSCDSHIRCQHPLFSTNPSVRRQTRLRIELGAPMSPHFPSMTQAIAPNRQLRFVLGLLCSCHQYHHNYQPRFLQVNLHHTTGATSQHLLISLQLLSSFLIPFIILPSTDSSIRVNAAIPPLPLVTRSEAPNTAYINLRSVPTSEQLASSSELMDYLSVQLHVVSLRRPPSNPLLPFPSTSPSSLDAPREAPQITAQNTTARGCSLTSPR
jgi:hypothetical protein